MKEQEGHIGLAKGGGLGTVDMPKAIEYERRYSAVRVERQIQKETEFDMAVST
jgi:hypothetical protein